MQQYAICVDKTDGSQFHGFGIAGSRGHQEAEQMRDTWQRFRAKDPRFYFTLVDPEGRTTNIATGDITDVRVIVGDKH
jgi:hypothetical protein